MTELNLIYRVFDGFDRSFSQQAEAYAADHPGFTLRRESHAVPPLYDKMVAGDGCRSGDYDLFLAITDWLPELMRDGALTPLDDFLAAEPPPDWPDGWPESLLRLPRSADGRIWAMPYHDGPQVLMYRADLFEAPWEQARFSREHGRDLVPPRTWGEFLEVAHFFTRPDDDLVGCVVAAEPDGHNDVYDFLLHLWSRGGVFLDAQHRPVFDGPEGVAALRYYLDLIHEHKVTQPNPWEYDSIRSGEFYASGRAAMMGNWVGFAIVADTPEVSRIPGLTRVTTLPKGDDPTGEIVSLIVYWAMTLPVGSRQKEAAWSFMRHLATPPMDKITSLVGGSGVRLSTWDDPEVQARYPYYAAFPAIHRVARTLPAIPEYPALNDVLDRMMAVLVPGRVTIEDGLRRAREECEAILGAAGYFG